MIEPTAEHLSEEELEQLEGPSEALTNSVRDLIDAVIRTEVGLNVLDDVRRQIDEATKRLRAKEIPGSFGVRFGFPGKLRAWGNTVVGLRNAIAPPLDVVWHDDGSVIGHAMLGAAYEGPAGYLHGGVSALLLDQALGEAAHASGHPGMTALLTLKYRRPAPLGPVRVEAAAMPGGGIKTTVRGRLISLADGKEELCVEAEGLFILPRAVRERVEEMNVETEER
jgi:acyl-coenzyme A thioesterase PaaI-like protein